MTDINQDIQDDSGANDIDTNAELVAARAEIDRLKGHHEKLLSEKQERLEAARLIEAEKLQIEQEAAKKNGDFEALEKSFSEKYKAQQDELESLHKQRDAQILESELSKVASRLSTNPHNQRIAHRLLRDETAMVDGKLVVLNKDGSMPISTMTARTLDDLERDFVSSGHNDSIIDGTKGSGSGGNGTGGKAVKSASEYSEAERIELATKNPELFKQTFK